MTLPAPAPDVRLTRREREVLAAICRHFDEYGFPPTLREIIAETSVTSTSVVAYLLGRLDAKGLIHHGREYARGILLTGGRYLVPNDIRRLAGL